MRAGLNVYQCNLKFKKYLNHVKNDICDISMLHYDWSIHVLTLQIKNQLFTNYIIY